MFGRKKIEPVGTIVDTTIKTSTATSETIPLDSFAIKELLALKTRLDGIIATRRAEVQAQFTEQLELYGLSIDEVKPKKRKRTFPIKYRDPENHNNTWSGVGRPKKWVQNYLDQGRQLADFAVDATDA